MREGIEKSISRSLLRAVAIAKITAESDIPIDTGNMRYNAFTLTNTGDLEWEISINKAIAPYVVYVNEKLPSHHTPRQQANEQFWQRAVQTIMRTLRKELGGKLSAQ